MLGYGKPPFRALPSVGCRVSMTRGPLPRACILSRTWSSSNSWLSCIWSKMTYHLQLCLLTTLNDITHARVSISMKILNSHCKIGFYVQECEMTDSVVIKKKYCPYVMQWKKQVIPKWYYLLECSIIFLLLSVSFLLSKRGGRECPFLFDSR